MRVELRNISKAYQGRQVLRGISMAFETGKSYALTGPSGVGKTTLLRILLGLEEPDTGKVQLMGDYKYPHINFGVVFQEDRLFEDFSAVANVCMVNRKLATQLAEEELSRLLPLEALHQPVRELSGGMRRRVAVVRACCMPSDFLVMDEPFSGLDAENRRTTLKYILEKKGKKPWVLSTHNMESLDFCQQLVINPA